MSKNNKYAILSFSGGFDSTSLLLKLLSEEFNVLCITFDYGQNHYHEIEKAEQNISYLSNSGFNSISLKHKIINIRDAFNNKSSSLFTNSEDIPTGHYEDKNMISTFVPNRNAIFTSILFSYALSWSKEMNGEKVYFSLGCHSGDHSIYPDCRPVFYQKLIEALKIGNWGGEKIIDYLPFINYTKADILKDVIPVISSLKLDFNTIFRNTLTSYTPDANGKSPGNTASDIERILAFNELNIKDPAEYQSNWEDILKNALKIEEEYRNSIK